MIKIRKAIAAGSSALVLALSLAACGGNQGQTATNDGGDVPAAEPAEPEKTVSHDATVDPSEINPGWLPPAEDYVAGTSDLWYPETGIKEYTVYFTNAANDAGIDATFVGKDDAEDNVWDLEVVDGHLKTKSDAEGKRQVDITFQNAFNCYDAVSDTTFVRGVPSEIEALFADKTFVEDAEDPDKYMLTFNADGTLTQSMKGNAISGTWKVEAVNVAKIHLVGDNSEWDDEVRVILDTDGKVIELDDGSSSNLVVYKG